MPVNGKLKSNSKSLDRHDRDGANGRANREIDERGLFAVQRGNSVNHDDSKGDNCSSIQQEP